MWGNSNQTSGENDGKRSGFINDGCEHSPSLSLSSINEILEDNSGDGKKRIESGNEYGFFCSESPDINHDNSATETACDSANHMSSSKGAGGHKSTNNNIATSGRQSPFFHPSTPSYETYKLRRILTPGGSFKYIKSKLLQLKQRKDEEHKSSIFGATANLINAIVGAGICGMPYAVKCTGLVSGVFSILFVAIATGKSFRLLIATAKHVDVPTYERLFEVTFGKLGFSFICLNMFLMAYGSMISYLMIIRDTLPVLLGASEDNMPLCSAILVVSTICVILPLACTRDVADLANISNINVSFDTLMAFIVAMFSPIADHVQRHGGGWKLVKGSIIRPNSYFIGLGILILAFGCHHSSFIIAGSLERPTNVRWGNVVHYSLTTSVFLVLLCGVAGYMGFGEATSGNILNNFMENGDDASRTKTVNNDYDYDLAFMAANVARALLCTTMFFVYPMDAFVARHVAVVLLFQGRRARDGDDHAVLSRADRRIGLTTFLYTLALLPAIFLNEVGSVLALTGTIAGNCLGYIGPGLSYLAANGEEFCELVEGLGWCNWEGTAVTGEDSGTGGQQQRLLKASSGKKAGASRTNVMTRKFLWYATLMPLWLLVAEQGHKRVERHREEEERRSPHPSRLGKVRHQRAMDARRPPISNTNISMVEGQHTSQQQYPTTQPRKIPTSLLAASRAESDDDTDVSSPETTAVGRVSSLPLIHGGISIGSWSPNTSNSGKLLIHPVKLKDRADIKEGYGSTLSRSSQKSFTDKKKQKRRLSSRSSRNWGSSSTLGGNETEDEDELLEDDPQELSPPRPVDFVIAIAYVVLGVFAMVVGLCSIAFTDDTTTRNVHAARAISTTKHI